MSHFIKDNAPNQLVTSGSQGFFGPSTLQYMYLNGNGTFDHKLYTAQMCTGVDFLADHDETTAIDLPSFHLYPGESLPPSLHPLPPLPPPPQEAMPLPSLPLPLLTPLSSPPWHRPPCRGAVRPGRPRQRLRPPVCTNPNQSPPQPR